jgi:branched-chain amino acid transport system substrate-binding protein
MMVTDGITALVTLWRNEAYGSGLAEEMKKRFEGMGNKVFPGIAYDPSNTDYDSLIASASDQVQTAVSQYGADHVAVMLISFQDVSDFLHAASVKPVMGVVHWYGCDANTQKTSVITDTTARNFAMKVRFLAPVMALGTASDVPATVTALASRIHAATGLEPDAMALSVYDAVMIYAQCVNFAGSGDAAKIKEILPQVCSAYDYLGVRRNLNYFGDLEGANYIFWTVREIIGGASWDSYATWIFQGDFIQTKY